MLFKFKFFKFTSMPGPFTDLLIILIIALDMKSDLRDAPAKQRDITIF